MDLQKVGYGSVNWIYLAQDRNGWESVVNVVMHLLVP
jgi:hypothetical protein